MSAVHTTPVETDEATGGASRPSLVRWIAGGTSVAAVAAAIAIAVWPASATDTARADGEQLGQAVNQLVNAESSAEVDVALTEVRTAADEARDHAGDEVADQITAQEDALARAADGFVGTHTTTDAFEADLYQAELNDAVDDLTSQADEFRTQGPEVRQAFWDGYETGLSGE
jgi:hypothetical protein